MGYRLKGESFEVVDGAFAGKKFVRGVEYAETEIPPVEKGKFEAVKGQRTEVGRRKAEVGGQKTEVGSRKTEVGSQETEVGGRKTEVGGRKTEVGGRKTEDGGRKSEVGSQETEVGGQKTDVKKKDASEGDAPATETAGKPAGVVGWKLKTVKPDAKDSKSKI